MSASKSASVLCDSSSLIDLSIANLGLDDYRDSPRIHGTQSRHIYDCHYQQICVFQQYVLTIAVVTVLLRVLEASQVEFRNLLAFFSLRHLPVGATYTCSHWFYQMLKQLREME